MMREMVPAHNAGTISLIIAGSMRETIYCKLTGQYSRVIGWQRAA